MSLQGNRANLRTWKEFVARRANTAWGVRPPIQTGELHLTLVYLSGVQPADVDNIIKPIQDALVGLVLSDDSLIVAVESHRRLLTGSFDPMRLPPLLLTGLLTGRECVYVRLRDAQPLEELL
jgi:hypothetical protein